MHNRSRYLNKNIFFRQLPNGENQLRSWLVYSEFSKSLFCVPCKSFGRPHALTTGYTDWNNVHQRLKEHEESKPHKTSLITFSQRSNLANSLNAKLADQVQNEIDYWNQILKRVVSVTKSLSSRGLAFRGHDEKFGSLQNSNYMMCLELPAEYDHFLAMHIETRGNPGSGNISYLSSTICDEFIALMAGQVLRKIASDVLKAKYFSISADSTPDISHVDQLTFVIRYVDSGTPKERFIQFVSNYGHKAKELADSILDLLNNLGLDIKNCRGQSYDNASNMSDS